MKLLSLFLMLCAFIWQPSSIDACSCIGESTVESSVKSSKLVIVGTVLTGERISIADTSWSMGQDSAGHKIYLTHYKMKYTVLVTEKFKGKFDRDTIVIITGCGGGDCGYRFVVGSSYIIYGYESTELASEKFDVFGTNICTRTRLATDKSEIREIRKVTQRRGLFSRKQKVKED